MKLGMYYVLYFDLHFRETSNNQLFFGYRFDFYIYNYSDRFSHISWCTFVFIFLFEHPIKNQTKLFDFYNRTSIFCQML